MIKRILVALSGTPFTSVAVRYAIELARAHEAAITGVTLVNLEALSSVGPVPVGGGAAATDLAHYRQAVTEERIEQAITDFEAACREAGMIHCVTREAGDPFDRLISMWRYHDLTIVGLRGLFEYGVVHNPSDQLLRLMREGVRPIVAVAEHHRPIRRVLVAYSGSMTSAKAMKRFVQSRLWPDAHLDLAAFDRHPEEQETLLTDAAEYCHAHGFEVQAHPEIGSPRDGLLDLARRLDSDMVVLGASARSRMASWVLGDTTLQLVRNADVPLYLSR